MYMRLIGYPADKIAILTTYNGQKHLIRDVIKQRCANNPLIGQPSKVKLRGGRVVLFLRLPKLGYDLVLFSVSI